MAGIDCNGEKPSQSGRDFTYHHGISLHQKRVKRAHEFYAKPLAQFRLTLAQKVLLMYITTGIHRHSCSRMFRDDIGHLSQALFSQVPYYQAFYWEFIVDHQDRYRWFELQWIHMVYLLYWKSVLSTHQIYDFQDLEFVPGYYTHWNSWNLGTGPDYYSELVPRVLSTWDT